MTGFKSKKAAAQAIDKVDWADHEPDGLVQPEHDAATALREALEQPAQPDTDMAYTIALQRAIEWHCKGKAVPPDIAALCPHHAEKLNKALAQPAQPAQEPFGYLSIEDNPVFQKETPEIGRWKTLYTTPPQRPWVGLTEQQQSDIEDASEMMIGIVAFSLISDTLKANNT